MLRQRVPEGRPQPLMSYYERTIAQRLWGASNRPAEYERAPPLASLRRGWRAGWPAGKRSLVDSRYGLGLMLSHEGKLDHLACAVQLEGQRQHGNAEAREHGAEDVSDHIRRA